MIHGSVEFQVQWRLAALPHVLRTLNNIIGLSTLGGTVHGVEPVVEWHKRCWGDVAHGRDEFGLYVGRLIPHPL